MDRSIFSYIPSSWSPPYNICEPMFLEREVKIKSLSLSQIEGSLSLLKCYIKERGEWCYNRGGYNNKLTSTTKES